MRKNYFAKKFVAYSMAFAVAFSTLTVSPVFVKEAKAAATAVSDITTNGTADITDGTIFLSALDSDNSTIGTSISVGTLKTSLQTNAAISKLSLIATGDKVGDSAALEYEFHTATDSALKTAIATKTAESTLSDMLLDGKENKDKSLTGTGAAGKWYKLTQRKGTYSVKSGSDTANISYSYFEANRIATTNNYNFNGATELTSSDMGMYIFVEDGHTDAVAKFYNIAEKSDLDAKYRKENTLVSLGQDAKLSVVATKTGEKNFKYTWTKEGKDLNNDSAVLNLTNVKKEDLGTYKCVVSDGVKDIAVYQRVSLVTAGDVTGNANAHTILTNVNVLNSNDKLPSGKATLTSSIPTGDYAYVWIYSDDSKIKLSQSNTIDYNPTSNSITFEESAALTGVKGSIKCYAVPSTVYNATLETELKAVAEASGDVSKYEKNDALRDAEIDAAHSNVNLNALKLAAVYTETFTFGKTSSTTTSAIKNVKMGESITLAAPAELDSKDVTSHAHQYQWTINGGTVVSTDKDFVIDTIDVNDLGQITCTVKECAQTHTNEEVCNNTASGHASGKVLARLTYNMVYASDLTATASDVTAKVNQEDVTLNVTAKATLPITYAWRTRTHNGTTFGNVVDNLSGTRNEATYKFTGKFRSPFFTGEKNGSVLYVCVVSDGIQKIEVPVKVTEINTFRVYENNASVKSGNYLANNANITICSLKDDTIKLEPVVVAASETIEKELKYTWKKDGVVQSSDKDLTVTVSDTSVIYSVTITEGTNNITINYIVSPTTDKVLQTVELADINYDFEYTNIYTGKEINPIIYVKALKSTDTSNDTLGKTYELQYTLKEGIDYTVELTDAINAGVSVFKINFIGNFADVYKNIPVNNQIERNFAITRADNKVEIADSTVMVGKSVQPKTVTNLGKGALTYTYYADADCATEIAAPTKVGTYYVKATTAATMNYNEAESNVAKIVVAPATTKVTKVATNASAVKLTWTKVAGATKYRVFVKKSGKWAKVADTTSLTYTVKKLASATKYEFAVRAYAGSVASPKYVTKTAYTTPAKVATPAVKAGSKKATVSFKKVARATGYEIYMAKGTGKYVKVKTTTTNSFTKTGLTKGATYKFKVRAYKKVGSKVYYGAFSAVKAVKVK